MAWRLHLTNQTVSRLHILPGGSGQPTLLAVWFGSRVAYFNFATGAAVGERSVKDVPNVSRSEDKWQEFMVSLAAPNKAVLPWLRLNRLDILSSDDGRMRLYHAGHADLFLEIDGKEGKLDSGGAAEFLAVGLDRFLGLIAAVDEKGLLHLYQQYIPVGVFDVHLRLHDDMRPMIAIANGGSAIYVTGGQDVLVVDSGGRVSRRLDTHYFIGKMDCSPNGRWLVTCDLETNVIRAYSGSDLAVTHQRHAIDLMTEAAQIQLIADFPPATIAVSALAVGGKEALAFAMGGVICASAINAMQALPRPQKLF